MPTPIPTEGTHVYIRTIAGLDKEFLTHQTIDIPGGERNEKDRTTLLDDGEVVAPGIKRYGAITLSALHAEDDAGLTETEVAYEDAAPRLLTWVLPTGTYRQYTVWVKNFPFSDGGVDSDYTGGISFRRSGSVAKGSDFVPVLI